MLLKYSYFKNVILLYYNQHFTQSMNTLDLQNMGLVYNKYSRHAGFYIFFRYKKLKFSTFMNLHYQLHLRVL